MFLRTIDFGQRADPGERRLRRATIWLLLLILIPLSFLILVLFDASIATTVSRGGVVAQKYLSPELTTSSEQVMMDSKGEQIIVPIQQTIPVSYEVEVEEGCRFSVPPEMLTHIRDGDRIR